MAISLRVSGDFRSNQARIHSSVNEPPRKLGNFWKNRRTRFSTRVFWFLISTRWDSLNAFRTSPIENILRDFKCLISSLGEHCAWVADCFGKKNFTESCSLKIANLYHVSSSCHFSVNLRFSPSAVHKSTCELHMRCESLELAQTFSSSKVKLKIMPHKDQQIALKRNRLHSKISEKLD